MSDGHTDGLFWLQRDDAVCPQCEGDGQGLGEEGCDFCDGTGQAIEVIPLTLLEMDSYNNDNQSE